MAAMVVESLLGFTGFLLVLWGVNGGGWAIFCSVAGGAVLFGWLRKRIEQAHDLVPRLGFHGGHELQGFADGVGFAVHFGIGGWGVHPAAFKAQLCLYFSGSFIAHGVGSSAVAAQCAAVDLRQSRARLRPIKFQV